MWIVVQLQLQHYIDLRALAYDLIINQVRIYLFPVLLSRRTLAIMMYLYPKTRSHSKGCFMLWFGIKVDVYRHCIGILLLVYYFG